MAKIYEGKELKVGGTIYTVSEVEGLQRKYGLFGCVDFSDCVIQIDASLTDERKEQTLVHELLHAIQFEAGFNPEEQSEDLINRTSNVLHQVLAENYDILATPSEEDEILSVIDADECECFGDSLADTANHLGAIGSIGITKCGEDA